MTKRSSFGADKKILIAAGLLIAVTVAAYMPALQAGFIWDDDDYVTHNPVLRSPNGLVQIWFEPSSLPQYYPLVHTMFWIEYQLFELDPFIYHLINILLHGLGAVLLYMVLKKLDVPVPLMAAAVFAVHPVHVESVAWITERKNILSGVFYMLALLAWLKWRPLDEERKGPTRYYALCMAAFLGALFAKTVTCSLPAVILLLIWWKRARITRNDLMATVPFFVAGLAMAMVTATMEVEHVLARGSDWDLSFIERSLIAGRALWFYAAKLLWPFGLSFNYTRWEIDAGAAWQYLFPLAALGVIALLWCLRKRWGRGPLVSVLIFAGGLIPALGFFNVYPMVYSYVADHFQYLPSIALITLFVSLAANRLQRRFKSKTPAYLGLAVLALLGTLTWQQARVYKNLEILWADTIEKNPRSWLALGNLGGIRLNQGRFDEARALLEESLHIREPNPYAHNNLGMILLETNEIEKAREQFETALEQRPNYPEVHNNVAVLLWRQGHLDEAVSHLRKAVDLSPQYPDALRNLGEILVEQGKPEEGLPLLAAVSTYYGGDPALQLLLADLYTKKGDHQKAVLHYQVVIKLNRGYAPAYVGAAKGFLGLGQDDTARRLLAAALRLEPGNGEALTLLVDSLVHEEPGRRMGEAEKALVQLKERLPSILDAVASKLAAKGRYAEAIAAQERALEAAVKAGQMKEADRYRRKLEEFEAQR